jgi:DNA modification methylase
LAWPAARGGPESKRQKERTSEQRLTPPRSLRFAILLEEVIDAGEHEAAEQRISHSLRRHVNLVFFGSVARSKNGTGQREAAEPGPSRPRRSSAVIDTRVIYCGDCLDQLRKLPDGCVDLIYIDPPFNSNRNYEVFWGETKEKRSFEDRHESTQAYIEFMRPRCVELARVLKKTGSFYYHCDWHASHYVKVMLDQIFGENQFQNEIVWQRTFAHGNAGQSFGNVTDSIFYYVGSKKYVWNPVYGKFTPDYIEQRFAYSDPDKRHWQSVTLRNPSERPNLRYSYKASNGITYEPHPNGWSCDRTRMEKYDRENRLHFPSKPGGQLRLKMYLDESPGPLMQNLWDDIPPINSQAEESLGYPTQKPLPLLERIIGASSNENDIVLDAFCGCGTALLAAERLKRQWIGIDISPTACRVMAKRLRDETTLREDEKLWRVGRGFVVRDLPWTVEQLRKIPPFEFENWAVIALGGIPNKAQVGDMGIDGRIFPVSAMPEKRGELAFMDDWWPIQVKQKDKAGRPDIDLFEAAMIRADRKKGFFVSFEYSSDALTEVDRFFRTEHRVIVPFTVKEILEERIAKKLA